MRRTDPVRPDVLVARTPENLSCTYGDIIVQEVDGRAVVLEAAPRSRISLALLAPENRPWIRIWTDKISIVDQVIYQVVGWDPLSASLEVVLIKDHRPDPSTDRA